jgi:lipid-binding SYLF domain-containing protein
MMRLVSVFLLLAALLVSGAQAANPLEKRVIAATDVLRQLTAIPEQGIPPNLLNNAYGVAVLPNVIKAGFIIGGRFGKGILVVRRPDGSWSNPTFISLGGGSVGFQAGAQGTDIVLVFKSKQGVENIAKGKFTLGGDAAVAAGPVGRFTSASTDATLRAEIYSYSRNRGLFGGIALDGSVLSIDDNANFGYYQSGNITAQNLLFDDAAIPAPIEAREFKERLSASAPPLRWQPEGTRQAAIEPTPAQAEEPAEARTYGIDDAPPAGDSIF